MLSTLHTNSAAAAVTRLLDMGVEEYLLSSTLTVIVGQRLVRKLCMHCRAPDPIPEDLRLRFRDLIPPDPDAHLYRAVGCDRCANAGYAGRVAIAECLEVTDGLRRLISAKADAHAIEALAVAEGMTTIAQDGIRKAFAGLTTISEVLRVTQSG
jgi:general secretion pathway protein E